MSIAEFPPQNGSSGSTNTARYNAPQSVEFERTPPQDLNAEQGVLGGMLLSKEAIADVVEVLKERDFYRPAHELIYDAILDLYGRGEPADPVTVASELTKRGDIARAGGAPYLHTLISSVPTAANAGYYARIVRDHAIMRRLVEAGTKIVQLGYSKEGEPRFGQFWKAAVSATNVDTTTALAITYQGKPINVFFSSSTGGMTATSKDVWGTDYPYLVSVPDPWSLDGKLNPKYRSYFLLLLRPIQ